eukprot:1024850-Rhodomonas_salina.1
MEEAPQLDHCFKCPSASRPSPRPPLAQAQMALRRAPMLCLLPLCLRDPGCAIAERGLRVAALRAARTETGCRWHIPRGCPELRPAGARLRQRGQGAHTLHRCAP